MRYTPDMRRRAWPRGGFRFRCTRCGDCCRRPGTVYLEPGEGDALRQHTRGRTVDAAAYIQWDAASGQECIDTPPQGACPLLGADGLCTVQAVKPRQCRTYPFWPEILRDPEEAEAARRACEGIGLPDAPFFPLAGLRSP